jgi:hypothetical protein
VDRREDYNSFSRAMVKKLIAEITTRPEQQRSVSTIDVPEYHVEGSP